METKTINTKEQKELDKLNARLAALDMERAEIVKQIRENPTFAVHFIKHKIKNIIDKYFDTPNKDLIYRVNSADVKLTTNFDHYVGSVKSKTVKNYTVSMLVTKYDKKGQSFASSYEITAAELPKDVEKWLTMGNSELSQADAKSYITSALIAEKKALQARITEINSKLK
jgi:hypothetical protein